MKHPFLFVLAATVACAAEPSPLDQSVGQFMTPRPTAVHQHDTLNYVLHKMDGGGHRHVPVLDDGRPTSVISVRDMLRHILKLCKDHS